MGDYDADSGKNPVGRMDHTNALPPMMHQSSNGDESLHEPRYQQQQQQQQPLDGLPPPLPPASMTRLTAKPHAFAGAVLSPKHARELNPTLCMAITSSLAEQQQNPNSNPDNNHISSGSGSSSSANSSVVPYTLWITEAWRVLGWAEPSAALFWEMATLFAALQAAGRDYYYSDGCAHHPHGGSYHTSQSQSQQQPASQQHHVPYTSRSGFNSIPPILSCGSTGSMTSGATSSHAATALAAEKASKKFSSAVSAKELPIWLVGTFLLLHCEEYACQRSLGGEDERRFAYHNHHAAATELQQQTSPAGGRMDFGSMFRHQALSPRYVTYWQKYSIVSPHCFSFLQIIALHCFTLPCCCTSFFELLAEPVPGDHDV